MLYASEISQSVERMNRGAVQGLIARMALTLGGYTLMPDYTNPASPGEIRRMKEDNYLDYYEIANTYCRKLRDSGKHTLANTDFLQVLLRTNVRKYIHQTKICYLKFLMRQLIAVV